MQHWICTTLLLVAVHVVPKENARKHSKAPSTDLVVEPIRQCVVRTTRNVWMRRLSMERDACDQGELQITHVAGDVRQTAQHLVDVGSVAAQAIVLSRSKIKKWVLAVTGGAISPCVARIMRSANMDVVGSSAVLQEPRRMSKL